MDYVPTFMADYFEKAEAGEAWEDPRWKCKLCGKVIIANSLGANSHIAWHVREIEKRKKERAK